MSLAWEETVAEAMIELGAIGSRSGLDSSFERSTQPIARAQRRLCL